MSKAFNKRIYEGQPFNVVILMAGHGTFFAVTEYQELKLLFSNLGRPMMTGLIDNLQLGFSDGICIRFRTSTNKAHKIMYRLLATDPYPHPIVPRNIAAFHLFIFHSHHVYSILFSNTHYSCPFGVCRQATSSLFGLNYQKAQFHSLQRRLKANGLERISSRIPADFMPTQNVFELAGSFDRTSLKHIELFCDG